MELETDIHIDAGTKRIFAVLAALERYGDWLPHSDVHRGIELTCDGPVQEGTTYVDRQGAGGDMSGTVCLCDPPNSIGFRQFARLPIGTIVARTDFRLEPDGSGTRVVRHQQISLPWPAWPFQPIFRMKVRSESVRVLDALKRAVEQGPQAP